MALLNETDEFSARQSLGGLSKVVLDFYALRYVTAPNLAGTLTVMYGVTFQDQLGGMFIWNASDTSADNASTIIRPYSVPLASPGRWNLMLAQGQAPSGVVAGLGQGITFTSSPYVILSTDRGKNISVGTATAITVPAASTLGAGFIVAITAFYGFGNAVTTISGAAQTFTTPQGQFVTSLNLKPGESVILMARSGNFWEVVGGTGFNAQAAALVPTIATLTDAATITTNAELGNVGDVTITASRAMAAPTNPSNGQRFTWRITQGGAGSFTITWDAVFDFGQQGPPVLSTAPGSVNEVSGTYDAAAALWLMEPTSAGSGSLVLNDPTDGFSVSLEAQDNGADRVLSLPVLPADDEVVTANTAQTVTGLKTFMNLASPTLSGTPQGTIAYDPGQNAQNTLRVASNVAEGETITINLDIFEIEIVNTDSTDNTAGGSWNQASTPITVLAATYPNLPTTLGSLIRVQNEILRLTVTGASLTFARAQSGTTIAAHADALDIFKGNGVTGSNIAVGLVTTLTPAAFTAAFVADFNAYNAADITATLINANVIFFLEDNAGALAAVCTETLAGANNGFAEAFMYGGQAQGVRLVWLTARVPLAQEVTLDQMRFGYPYTPTTVLVFVAPTATPGVYKAWDGTVSVADGVVTIDNSGAVDWAVTDTVTVLAFG